MAVAHYFSQKKEFKGSFNLMMTCLANLCILESSNTISLVSPQAKRKCKVAGKKRMCKKVEIKREQIICLQELLLR